MKNKALYLITAIIGFFPIPINSSFFSAFFEKLNFSHILFPDRNEIPESDQIALAVIDETAKILKKKYGINPCGIGMRGHFEELGIDFQVSKPLSKEQARVMLVDCIKIFLEKINSTEKIKPYLKNYPFNEQNISITFFIQDQDGRDLFDPQICIAKWTSFEVTFRTNDPENIYRYKTTEKETHEEALALVEQHKAELAQASEDRTSQ